MLTGYLGTTITQTMTFAADEFDASKAAQGSTLGAVRAGVLLSLILMAAADRRGRKRLLTICAVGGAVASAAGALAPSLWALGATQTFARAFSTALALLIGVVAAEEMPSGGRAFAASVLAMTGALGAGGAVILLPLAGLAPWTWRIIYLVPLVGLVFFLRVSRDIPESRRFLRPHARTTMRGHRGRLLLLGASGFFGLIFLAPITQFQNDFLRDEHGFAAWQLTVFTFATSTPAGIGVIVGGRLADERGRRIVGAVGTLGGAIFLALAYQVDGPWLWVCWLVGSMVAAVTVPALGVYGPELFPTALRGKANGLITLGSVAGSTVGLFLAGRFADEWGSLGPGIAILALGPLIVSLLVLTLYPETAHLELEDINPEDALDLRGRVTPPPIL
jgi:MFS family permease